MELDDLQKKLPKRKMRRKNETAAPKTPAPKLPKGLTKAEIQAIVDGESEAEIQAKKITQLQKSEEPIDWNDGQKRVLKALQDKEIREVLVASGARCFTGDTLVRTDSGLVPIRDIREGDTVLSVNPKTNKTEFKSVEIKFEEKQGRRKAMVTFVLSGGSRISCTVEHELYQEQERVFALDFAWRVMSSGEWESGALPGEQSHEDTYPELEVYRRSGCQQTALFTPELPPDDGQARYIDSAEVEEVHFWITEDPVYDICVADNHNYCIGRENILVSNSGKTFMIICIIITRAILFPGSRHLIARKWFSHAKASVWLDTLPKALDKMVPDLKPLLHWNNTDFFLRFPNGAEIWVAGLDDKEKVDKILGREYMTIFFNEASEISYDVYTTVKTRLAQKCERNVDYMAYGRKATRVEVGRNMVFVDENPPSSKHWTKVLFVDRLEPETRTPVKRPERYLYERIEPWENAANLGPDYIEEMKNLPPSKRRRFYEGLFGDDSQYALWSTEDIAKNRVFQHPPLRRIVVAIDPAVSKTDTSDDTGIVVKGVGFNDHCYLLADLTGKYSPTEWAEVAVKAYHDWKADEVVAEVNNGGDLVETVLRTVSKRIPYRGVHATRNKYTRAEPVAALAAQGVDHHVGEYPEMEEEMTTWEGKKGEKSPNRIDANVWATFALLPDMHQWKGRQVGGNFAAAMRGDYGQN